MENSLFNFLLALPLTFAEDDPYILLISLSSPLTLTLSLIPFSRLVYLGFDYISKYVFSSCFFLKVRLMMLSKLSSRTLFSFLPKWIHKYAVYLSFLWALWRKVIERLNDNANTFEFPLGYLNQVSESIFHKQQACYFWPISSYILSKLLCYPVKSGLSLILTTSLIIWLSFLKALSSLSLRFLSNVSESRETSMSAYTSKAHMLCDLLLLTPRSNDISPFSRCFMLWSVTERVDFSDFI